MAIHLTCKGHAVNALEGDEAVGLHSGALQQEHNLQDGQLPCSDMYTNRKTTIKAQAVRKKAGRAQQQMHQIKRMCTPVAVVAVSVCWWLFKVLNMSPSV
jgi:hypothetical protein